MDRVRLGMVGGGPGALIGAVHRTAAAMTGDYELVAGTFSRDSRASRALAAELGLHNERAYDSYAAMFAAEAALPDAHAVRRRGDAE